MKYKALAAVALTAAATGAWAQSDMDMASSKLYLEAGYTRLNTDNNVGTGFNPTVIRFIAGADVAHNLAIEAMVALSAKDDVVTRNGVNTQSRTKVHNMYGLYLKPHAMVGDNLEVFGRFGYVQARLKRFAPGFRISDSEDGASYGMGASYKLTENLSLTGDYLVYISEKTSGSAKGKLEGVNIGLRYNF